MAHRVLHDDVIHHGPDGAYLQLLAARISACVVDDDEIRLQVSGGIEIVLRNPSQLVIHDGDRSMTLEHPADFPLLERSHHSLMRRSISTSEGAIEITVEAGDDRELTLIASADNWLVKFNDGREYFGLSAGGVGSFPPANLT